MSADDAAWVVAMSSRVMPLLCGWLSISMADDERALVHPPARTRLMVSRNHSALCFGVRACVS
ncbi:MAG: hypothetical protein JWO67_3258 [Streptosporangiaceae bacterium]|nr:hypothetical protein [Streptosporangiaceae bacterium]